MDKPIIHNFKLIQKLSFSKNNFHKFSIFLREFQNKRIKRGGERNGTG